MLRIFINPGHDMDLDPGACANGIREVDIALAIGEKVKRQWKLSAIHASLSRVII